MAAQFRFPRLRRNGGDFGAKDKRPGGTMVDNATVAIPVGPVSSDQRFPDPGFWAVTERQAQVKSIGRLT